MGYDTLYWHGADRSNKNPGCVVRGNANSQTAKNYALVVKGIIYFQNILKILF